MENLGAMADSQYTGFHKITNRDVLDLQCICQSCLHFFLQDIRVMVVIKSQLIMNNGSN